MKLESTRAKNLTEPSATYGDYSPEWIDDEHLAWIRSNRTTAKVMVSGPNGNRLFEWIADVNLGADFYEQWN
jgi:hypothetical protein